MQLCSPWQSERVAPKVPQCIESQSSRTRLSLLPFRHWYGAWIFTRQPHTSLVSASWVTSSLPTHSDSSSRQLRKQTATLFDGAPEFVDNVMRRPAPEHAHVSFRLAQEDIQNKMASGLLSREEVDQMHRVGGWRPMIRFSSHTGQ